MLKFFLQAIVIILLSYPVVSAINSLAGFIIAKFIKNSKFEVINNNIHKISILVPIKNEELLIENTINFLCSKLSYKNYEVIAINDNSTDNSLEILKVCSQKYKNLKILNLKHNFGKSKALNVALNYVDSEFVLVCDGDTTMQVDALERYIQYFIEDESIGAVSGTIAINNNKKLIEKSQIIEFTNLLGLVKRTQQHVYRRIFTLSGANAMYRKHALYDVGLFRTNRRAEDIAITMDLQLNGWKTHFAPQIVFYTSVPKSWTQLFKQRLRWAIGGLETWISKTPKIFKNPFNNLGLIMIWIDYVITIVWTITFFILLFMFGYDSFNYFQLHKYFELAQLVEYILIFVHFQIIFGFIEIMLAISIDVSDNKWKYLFYAPLYILFYWVVNPLTLILGILPAIKNLIKNKDEGWISPKRK